MEFAMTSTFTACGSDDEEEVAGYSKVVTVKEDGTTSDGSRFVRIDDQNFYLDYIKYTVNQGHLVVSGYDEVGFDGVAKIVSGVNYKGNSYEVLGIQGYNDKEKINGAFSNCTKLTAITIPNSITYIGKEAFLGCTSLTSVIIPNSVTNFGKEAFKGCTGLATIIISEGVTSIWAGAFYGCSGLTSITIPESVTSIGMDAFYGCIQLTSIIIPDGVTSVGASAFYGCIGLTSIIIPEGVTSIGRGAFYDCSGLTSITIPNSMTSIDKGAFSGCSVLKDVYCYAEIVPEVSYIIENTSPFFRTPISKATLHVPAGSIDAYKNTWPWKDFGNIVAIE